ncbi:MAG: hypothetical protein EHM37_19735 [Deltaproteobacteria bacterium]|nr:MAG: hypothetical protein EHM37_19735 [Deltaproteobacteria bacterium]
MNMKNQDVTVTGLISPSMAGFSVPSDDVREAVKTFVELYNSQWRVEKNGFRSPDEIRQAA